MFQRILILLIVLIGLQSVSAQEQKPLKKVVIVEKKDVNGIVTETIKEAEGDKAEALIKSLDVDGMDKITNESEDQKQKTISITKKISKGISDDKMVGNDGPSKIKIVTIKDGEEKVLEWDGSGEIPTEMSKEIENIDILQEQDGEKMMITIDADELGTKDGQVILLKDRDENPGRKHMLWKGKDKDKPSRPTNKAVLGVEIDNTDNGVVITEVVEGSAADKAGLRRGDTILKINKTYIFTLNGLLDALNPFNPNDKIKVSYLRDGKEKRVNATLGSR
ncbi:MAG: PDZ domain-containing protein [Saprospiraceae bacterium]